jgi:predicted MFS family arabinose efflux permease
MLDGRFFLHCIHNNIAPMPTILIALLLSLGAALALGVSRFSYGLLLTPMKDSLNWSYLLAGAMGTANAVGYFVGALSAPALMRRVSAERVFWMSAIVTGGLMLWAGFTTDTSQLMTQRVATGISSAVIFITGGVLAARMASQPGAKSGLLLGLFYGGTGFGIVASSLLVPTAKAISSGPYAWQTAWLALGLICFPSAIAMWGASKHIPSASTASTQRASAPLHSFPFVLAGYFMFGVGYIGYMTFAIALLREQGQGARVITVYFTLLGCAVVLAPFVWARMLDRFRGGQSLAVLNGLAGLATIMISGIVFGGVFLAAVSSTTVFVKHNLPQASWPAGISAFTTIFALGQIIGPTVVGWVSDGAGGLQRGLLFSGVALLIGATIAVCQRPLQSAKL